MRGKIAETTRRKYKSNPLPTFQELSCDFSRRAADCVWGSTESSDGTDTEIASNAWTVGHGPLNTEKLYSLTGLSTAPGKDLLEVYVLRC